MEKCLRRNRMPNNETRKCSICGKKYTGWGNNAWPVNDGECCDKCNGDYVIPARIAQIYGGNHAKKETDDV